MKIILRPCRRATIRVLSGLALHIDLESADVKTVRGKSGFKSLRSPDEEIMRLYPIGHHICVYGMIDNGEMHTNSAHIARLHFKSNRSGQ